MDLLGTFAFALIITAQFLAVFAVHGMHREGRGDDHHDAPLKPAPAHHRV
jgi:hypothetical protein